MSLSQFGASHFDQKLVGHNLLLAALFQASVLGRVVTFFTACIFLSVGSILLIAKGQLGKVSWLVGMLLSL